MKNPSLTRLLRRPKEPAPDSTQWLDALIASIHGQTFYQLNVGQELVIREHLRYALVVGWENKPYYDEAKHRSMENEKCRS